MIKKGTKYKWVEAKGFCPDRRTYRDVYKENHSLKNMDIMAKFVTIFIQRAPILVGGKGCKLCKYHVISRGGKVGCSFKNK